MTFFIYILTSHLRFNEHLKWVNLNLDLVKEYYYYPFIIWLNFNILNYNNVYVLQIKYVSLY